MRHDPIEEILTAIPDPQPSPIAWGRVQSADPLVVRFIGDPLTDCPVQLRLTNYQPAPGDIVALAKFGAQWVMVGAMTSIPTVNQPPAPHTIGSHADTIAQGVTLDRLETAGMFWSGMWDNEVTYQRGAVVLDPPWLMIANKDTSEPPSPTGSPEGALWLFDLLDDLTFSFPTQTGFIQTGHVYAVSDEAREVSIVTAYRAYIPEVASVTYSLRVMDLTDEDAPRLVLALTLTPSTTGWLEVPVSPRLVAPGDVLAVSLRAEKIGTPTQWTRRWQYEGTSSPSDPDAGKYTRAGDHSTLHISKEDDPGNNAGPDLLALTTGDTLYLEEEQPTRNALYRLTAPPTDHAGTPGWVEYAVTLENTNSTIRSGKKVDITGSASGAGVPTQFARDAGYWPGNQLENVTIGGFELGACDPPDPASLNDHAYGVDVQSDILTLPDDWDPMARSAT